MEGWFLSWVEFKSSPVVMIFILQICFWHVSAVKSMAAKNQAPTKARSTELQL